MDSWRPLRVAEAQVVPEDGGVSAQAPHAPRQSFGFAGLQVVLALGIGIGIGIMVGGVGVGLMVGGGIGSGGQHPGIRARELQQKHLPTVDWNHKSYFWHDSQASGYYSIVTVKVLGAESPAATRIIQQFHDQWYCEKALSAIDSSPYVLAVPARANLYQAGAGEASKDINIFLELGILEALDTEGIAAVVTIHNIGLAFTGTGKMPQYSDAGACKKYSVKAGEAGSLDMPLNKDADPTDCAPGVVAAGQSCNVFNDRPTYKSKNGAEGNAYLYYDVTGRWRVGWTKIGQTTDNDMVCESFEDTEPELCKWEIGKRWDKIEVVCSKP